MKTLVLLVALALPAAADVQFTLQADESRADESAGTIPARATITGATEPVTLQLHIPNVVVNDPSWTCTGTSPDLECTHAPAETLVLDFLLQFPEHAGRAFGYAVVKSGDAWLLRELAATLWRRYPVTSALDDGAGSLRAAILAVNQEPSCSRLPCRIAIEGPLTIAFLTPLPTLVANDVEIDAHDVQLHSAALARGNGLHIRGDRMAVRGLAIRAFPENGIFYEPVKRGSTFVIEQCVIESNGVRGIVIERGVVRDSHIRDNVIRGNGRSGIFVVTSMDPGLPIFPVITVARNLIEWNGASGIFFGPETQQMFASDNVITHNAHMGIAVARGATLVRFGANRIFANGLQAIDYFLDGPTGPFDLNGAGVTGQIVSATYDATSNTTTITGTGPRDLGWLTFDYHLYANDDSDAEAEDFLGTTSARSDGSFTLVAHRDLRGKYLTVHATRGVDRTFYDTYELSAPFFVGN